MKKAKIQFPLLDQKEQKIVDAITGMGGDAFRTDLRKEVGGSNTTFMRKIESLKEKGMIEEYKRSDGRLKTAYRITMHMRHMFDLQKVLRMQKWFSASQKIELVPELDRIGQALMGNDSSIYRMLGIEPQYMSLQTTLASKEAPSMQDEEVREILSMCSAFLQNIVTSRLHPKVDSSVDGYIIFRYRLEKPEEELQQLLPQYLMDYLKAADQLEQHKAISSLTELAIQYPNMLPSITMAASNAARSLGLEKELKTLHHNYKSYKEEEEPMHSTRVHLIISALNIFKKLYAIYQQKNDKRRK